MTFFSDKAFRGLVYALVVIFLSLTFIIRDAYVQPPPPPGGPTYTTSAHGRNDYGVNRSTLSSFGYSTGNCAHCHEQHAMIGGTEPAPNSGGAFGPDKFLLFDENHTSQTVNFCFDCHTSVASYQSGGISINKSYSYNFAGNSRGASYVDDDIAAAFSHTAAGSSHYLPDIVSQALGKTMYDADSVAWSLPADTNPCDACHNPHIVQRNKNAPYDATKSAISRPSDHNNRWGDDVTERMNAAYADYSAPYWDGKLTYEPANDLTRDGSNLPNHVRLCTDCHNDINTIYSTNPRLTGGPRNIKQMSWKTSSVVVTVDAHGLYHNPFGGINFPTANYTAGQPYTLNCTDCHEPHGSKTNRALIRTTVNGTNADMPDMSNTSYINFCYYACHTNSQHKWDKGSCYTCHYHGAPKGGF